MTQGRRRLLRVFVGAQIVVSLILVSVAQMTSAGLDRIVRAPSGFDEAQLLMKGIRLPQENYPDSTSRQAYFRRVMEALAGHPSVERTALATSPPRMPLSTVQVLDPDEDLRTERSIPMLQGTSGYFATVGLRVLRGGDTRSNRTGLLGREHDVVVNEKLAELLWAGDDPVGRLLLVDGVVRQVSGVVANALHDLDGASGDSFGPVLYGALSAGEPGARILHVRTNDLSERARRELDETIQSQDPFLASPPLFTSSELLKEAFTQQHVARTWLQGYALLALLLSAISIFSVTASSTAQRQHEMGVRLALGAPAWSNLVEVIRGTCLVAGIAIGSGLPLSFLAGHLLSNFLVGLQGVGPSLFEAATVLASTALVASLGPSLRLLVLDPAEVLRSE